VISLDFDQTSRSAVYGWFWLWQMVSGKGTHHVGPTGLMSAGSIGTDTSFVTPWE
jgi:hypothetical protein